MKGKSVRTATNILQSTSDLLLKEAVEEPRWYKPVAYNPPVTSHIKKVREDVLRELKANEVKQAKSDRLYNTRLKPGSFRTDLLNPTEPIKFIADDLRDLFYKQHPWELATPRMMTENEHNIDIESLNWSSIIQLAKPLDGESVVQRTLYLLKNDKEGKYSSILEAYEVAKYEYYDFKMKHDLEVQIMKEESDMFGGINDAFSQIHKSFEYEDKILQKWRKDGTSRTAVQADRLAEMEAQASINSDAEAKGEAAEAAANAAADAKAQAEVEGTRESRNKKSSKGLNFAQFINDNLAEK